MSDAYRHVSGNEPVRPAQCAQAGPSLLLKRLLDALGATVLLSVLAPILVVCAAAIALETGRPVFYRGIRVGKLQRRFRIWKFRSMVADADDLLHKEGIANALSGGPNDTEGPGVVFKVPHDPRITKVGRFLRRMSLDELPQLFNVLRGEMSLVGPRPEVEYAIEYYGPQHFRRFDVLPGMTGLWQVSGRSAVSPRRMLELDIEYVERWSLWLDIRLLLRTIPVAMSRSGA